MDDALLVRGFERFGNLLGNRKCFIERNGTACDALREIVTLDEFHDERVNATGPLEPVDGGDVGMIQRREGLGFPLESVRGVRYLARMRPAAL